MADNTVQIRVSAAKVNAQFESLGRSGQAGFNRVQASIPPLRYSMQQIVEETDRGILSNRESTRLLTEELGIHLPRAVTSGIAEMLPAIGNLGGALLAAFAVREVIEFGEKIRDAAKEASGMTVAATQMADAVKANTMAMEDYAKSSSYAAHKELNEMNARIASWTIALQARRDYFANENAVAYAMQFYLGEVGKTAEAEEKLKDMEAERAKIISILKEDVIEEGKESTKTVKAAAEALDAYKVNAVDPVAMAVRAWALEQDRLNKANEQVIRDFGVMNFVFELLPRQLALTRADIAALTPAIAAETTQTKHLSVATQELIYLKQILHDLDKEKIRDAMDVASGLAAEFAQLVGGSKAAAKVRGAFMMAEGAYDIARGIFPPNPGLLARGAGEELAGLEMLGVGGGGGARRSAGSYGGGVGTPTGSWEAQREVAGPLGAMASGASGSGGRFGPGSGLVMVFGGPDVHAWMAQTVTEATNRGHTVISTSSQRGSPVGH